MKTLILSTILVLCSATAHARLDGSMTDEQRTHLSASVKLYLHGKLFGGDEALDRELNELNAVLVFKSKSGAEVSRAEARQEIASAGGLVTYACILDKNSFLSRQKTAWSGCPNELNVIQLSNPGKIIYGIDGTQPVGQRTFLPTVAQ